MKVATARRIAACALLLALVSAETLSGATPSVSLFNGKDLSGWRVVGGQAWSARDGLLVCSGEGRGWLRSEKVYKDFVLRLEYRIPKGGNSGVFLRAGEAGDPSFTGMQVQIYDDSHLPLDGKSSGAIVDSVIPKINASRPAGEWNTMEIVCVGSMVTVRHNGRRILRVDIDSPAANDGLKPEYRLAGRTKPGYIGLQNHGLPCEFRNIEIRTV